MLRHNRRFHLYLIRVAFTSFAFSLYVLVIPVFAYLYSGSLIFTGLVLFAQYGVYALTFLTGPLVDRIKNKRTIFVGSYGTIAIIALFLDIVIRLNLITSSILIISVAMIAMSDNFAWTAGHTVLPLLIEKSDLFRANGYAHLISGSHAVGGFAIGGIILIFIGELDSIFLYCLAMAAAAFVSLFISLESAWPTSKSRGSFMDGWKYIIKNHRSLTWLAVYLSLIYFFGLVPLVFILRETAGSVWYVIFYASYMVGGSVAGPLMGVLNPRRKTGYWIVSWAIVYAFMIITSSYIFSNRVSEISVWIAAGISFDSCIILFNVYLQGSVNVNFLGRSASSLYTFRGVSSAVGALIIPYIVVIIGINATGILAFALIVPISLILLITGESLKGTNF